MTLDEIVGDIADAHGRGLDVARVHSGDPSLYGAIAEQMRRLEALGIPYDVTPGVPAFAAAAAALGRELTLPGIAQTVILTRTATRASPMPEREALERLAASGATLAIHLSIANLARVVRALTPHYGADCPAVVAYRVSWPDERLIRGTLADIRAKVKQARITRTALVLVGRDSRRQRRSREPALRRRPPSSAAAAALPRGGIRYERSSLQRARRLGDGGRADRPQRNRADGRVLPARR